MTYLLITDIPVVDLEQLQRAIRDVIHWHTHRPLTAEDVADRDNAYIRLRQMDWHVSDAINGKRGRAA